MNFKRKDLLGIQELSADEINLILDTAKTFKEVSGRVIKKVPTLRGKTVVNLFYEPSTRTRVSFELAAKRLSADVINISVQTSSVIKGESLKDTAKTIEALQTSILIIRHPEAGVPYLLSKMVSYSIINAGDGCHEHPTQALLDIFTIKEKKDRVKDLKIAIVGDILHSRVARSNIWGLTKLGAEVTVCGPPNLIPTEIEKLGIKTSYFIEEAVEGKDVIMLLRVQLERQTRTFFPSLREYIHLYCLNKERLKLAKDDVLIMHPGPINRDVEISSEVADGPYSVITDQVANGIAVRMAVLYLLSGGKR